MTESSTILRDGFKMMAMMGRLVAKNGDRQLAVNILPLIIRIGSEPVPVFGLAPLADVL